MNDSIDELLENDVIELLYGNLQPIFDAIRTGKKLKFNPNFYTFEVTRKDLSSIKTIKRFTVVPSERHCQFETELADGRQIEVSCKISDDGLAIVSARVLI